MSNHYAAIRWNRNQQDFLDNRYSRAHTWTFDGGLCVTASSSPHIVPLPYSETAAVDPEEAFVASLSSCHMLFFLSLAAKAGYRVDRYEDQAVGVMNKDAEGITTISDVTLRPHTLFEGIGPDTHELASLHQRAHHHCFIANSVKSNIHIEIQP